MTVTFRIHGVKNGTGLVRGLAFNKNNGGFPEDRKKAVNMAQSPAKKGTVELVFKDVPGTSASFAFFHDEKETGKIQKSLLGIPRSGVGASNWARKGRPGYAKSLVKLAPKMEATLKYF